MVKKIKNIIIGWYRYLFKSQSNYAKVRIDICNKCEHRIFMDEYPICGKCFCLISAKAEVKDEICLDGRWPNVND